MNDAPLPNPSPAEGETGYADPVPLPQRRERESKAQRSRERGREDVLRARAKRMRSEPTPAEHRLWQILRAKRLAGYKFKRQLPLDRYIADFVCIERRLIIEADGGQHNESDYDEERDAHLRAAGFRILRFWNSDIFNNEEGVLISISNALQTSLPNPSPAEGERG